MNTNNLSLAHLSDDQLLVRVKEIVRQDRVTTARLLAHLAEMEERKLYCREACPSLFSYCVEVLHLSEPAAYRRVKAARLAKRFPVVLDMLSEGAIHLAALDVLAAHLTNTNHVSVLREACHKTKREVEELAARLRPLPDAPSTIRKLPKAQLGETGRAASPVPEGTITNLIQEPAAGEATEPGPARDPGANQEAAAEVLVEPRSEPSGRPAPPDPNPEHRPVIAPLSPARYRVQFTASADTCRKLRQVQELMRHRVPDGDPAAIVDAALTVLLEKLLREKTGAVARPRRGKPAEAESGKGERQQPAPGTGEARRRRGAAGKSTETRHIPAAVKRAVWRRDGGRCAFTTGNGRRCSSRGPLEFHHVEPYVLGGKATVDNISLRCRAHNAYEGELCFGKRRPAFRSGNPRELSPERVPEAATARLSPGRVGAPADGRTEELTVRGAG